MGYKSQFSDSRLDAPTLHLNLIVAGTLVYAGVSALVALSFEDKLTFLWGGPLESLSILLIVLTGELAAGAFLCIASQVKSLSPVQGKFTSFAEIVFNHLFVAWHTRQFASTSDPEIAVKTVMVRTFSRASLCSHLTSCWTPGMSPRVDYA